MYEFEAGLIRRLIADPNCRVIYRVHAERVRMVERNITENDVKAVLRKCRETEVRDSPRGPVFSAEAKDHDGRNLRVCVSPREQQCAVIVVTTIDLDEK